MKLVEALWVASGGMLGALARWYLSSGIKNWEKLSLGPYPLSILLVNAIGCFLASKWAKSGLLSQNDMGLALGVGFLGAFTTLSALNLEVAEFARSGHLGLAMSYLALHIGICGLFSLAGFLF